MTTALIVAFTYWAIYVIDESFSWQALVRPIVAGPIVGLILGDVKTGIIMGGMLEAIYMGVVSIGGGAPADAYIATVIVVTYVIRGGLSMEAGLAISVPIGTLARNITNLVLPMHAYLIKFFEKFAAEGDAKNYSRLQMIYRFAFSRLFHTIVIFLAVLIGADTVGAFFAMLPSYVTSGLVIAGGMLPALGLGILTSMIFNKELGAFIMIGFALSAYFNLGTMAIAIIGGSVAVIMFYLDVEKNALIASVSTKKDEEFFE